MPGIIDDLIYIADKLDKSGLYQYANEADALIALAAKLEFPPQALRRTIESRLDQFEGDSVSKEEMQNIINESWDYLQQRGTEIGLELEDTSKQLVGGIKSLVEDIRKIKDRLSEDPDNRELNLQYSNDIKLLSKDLTILYRMEGSIPGRESPEEAQKVRSLLGDTLMEAENLARESFNAKYTTNYLDIIMQNFTEFHQQYIEFLNKKSALRDKKTERIQQMEYEIVVPEGQGISRDMLERDSVFSEYVKLEKQYEQNAGTFTSKAKDLMNFFNELAATNPGEAKNVVNTLGDAFNTVNDVARGERMREGVVGADE